MKVAFCFLTYGDLNRLDIWKKFLNNNQNKYNIYLHPKYSYNVKDPYFKNFILKHRVDTKKKSHISIVNATLRLLEEAYKNENNTRFVFLSQACVPLISFDSFYHEIMQYGNMIKVFYNNFNKNFKYNQLSNKLQKLLPIELLSKQHPQMILDRDTVKFLIENNFTRHFENMQCPDEHYFVNIIMLNKIKFRNRQICYCNPILRNTQGIIQKSLTKNHVKTLVNYGFMFARKVNKTTKISYHFQ